MPFSKCSAKSIRSDGETDPQVSGKVFWNTLNKSAPRTGGDGKIPGLPKLAPAPNKKSLFVIIE